MGRQQEDPRSMRLIIVSRGKRKFVQAEKHHFVFCSGFEVVLCLEDEASGSGHVVDLTT